MTGIKPQFFLPLDLHDFRIVDDNFHRPETKVFQCLQYGLFYAVKMIVLHNVLSVVVR
jgi:hypothetical protein